MKRLFPNTESKAAFTLLELLVAAAVFSILAVILLGVTSQTASIWEKAQAQKNRQQIARIALEAITRDLEAAALPLGTSQTNTLSFLVNPAGVDAGFLSPQAAFWQVRSGQSSYGFLDVGYFVRWTGAVPELCRLQIPATDNESIFRDSNHSPLSGTNRTVNSALLERLAPGTSAGNDDIKGLMSKNVIGLWFVLWNSVGVKIEPPYDSTTKTARPAFVDVSVAVIDQATAAKLTDAAQVTSHYAVGPDRFAGSLPASIRPGVQVFTKRVPIHGSF